MRDYIKLHWIVLLWGFTAILGRLIALPAAELVFYRAGLTAAVLFALLGWRGPSVRLPWRATALLLGTGLLIGLHWTLFFLSAKISNVSVCLVALATTALWTSLLEPLMVRGRRVKAQEILLGVVVIVAMAGIFGAGFRYWPGFLVGMGAALAGTVFSIVNGRLAGRFHHQVIASYEIAGACLFCGLAVALPAWCFPARFSMELGLTGLDWLWLLLLSGVCTVYAYAEYLELLKRVSVFTISLAVNLEPVYGMILAALLFQEHQVLGPRFYGGALVILGAVAAHPFLDRREKGAAAAV